MDVVETFGSCVNRLTDRDPEKGRLLLKTGWELEELKFRYFPRKTMAKSDQYLADLMMRAMLEPLKNPDHSAIVSIFVPCELLEAAGLHPYNAEAFSCYLNASKVERQCLQQADNDGLAETLCAYHRTFIGAAERGLMPKPKCIVYTNLTCDANLVTFPRLSKFYGVPSFAIDVPYTQTEEDVAYVERQLRDLKAFLEKEPGRKISDEEVKERVSCSRRTLEMFREAQETGSTRYVPTDLVSPLYGGMTNNILLGTSEEEQYVTLLKKDMESAPPTRGKRIYWMHTIPFWSESVQSLLKMKLDARIVGDELQSCCEPDFDTDNPYRGMAERMVYHALNGPGPRRIQKGIENARRTKADGVVWFNHWGCKHTIGASLLAKKMFEKAGIPCLILDGDGCDRSHGGEGQTLTRLGAFLEMLNEDKS